jgi:hypothetical protein
MSIGAITNLASALLIAPDIAGDIVSVWLGGHDHVRADNREFNLFEDVPAAQTVIDSAAPHVRIPCCDVASILATTVEELEKELADCGKPGEYLFTIFRDYVGEHKCEKKVIWDISAVSYLTNPRRRGGRSFARKTRGRQHLELPDTRCRMLIAGRSTATRCSPIFSNAPRPRETSGSRRAERRGSFLRRSATTTLAGFRMLLGRTPA